MVLQDRYAGSLFSLKDKAKENHGVSVFVEYALNVALHGCESYHAPIISVDVLLLWEDGVGLSCSSAQ